MNSWKFSFLMLALPLVANPSHATSIECRIKPGSGVVKVTVSDRSSQVLELSAGDFVYPSNIESSDRQTVFRNGKILEIREDLYERGLLDCSAPSSQEFPLVVDGKNPNQLNLIYENFGIGIFYLLNDRDRRKIVKADHLFCSYFYKKDGTTSTSNGGYTDLIIDRRLFDRHRSLGFSLAHLCMVLEGAGINFDPETGERLPSFVLTQEGQLDSGEYLLRAPQCFARGRSIIKIAGQTSKITMTSTGCLFNFHPHSGRRMSELEAEVFGRETRYYFQPIKGFMGEDSKGLAKDVSRVVSSAKIEAIKKLEPQSKAVDNCIRFDKAGCVHDKKKE